MVGWAGVGDCCRYENDAAVLHKNTMPGIELSFLNNPGLLPDHDVMSNRVTPTRVPSQVYMLHEKLYQIYLLDQTESNSRTGQQ